MRGGGIYDDHMRILGSFGPRVSIPRDEELQRLDKTRRCSLCGSPSKTPPYPLASLTVGHTSVDVCSECEDGLQTAVYSLINGYRALNGLDPIPVPPKPSSQNSRMSGR